jgi:hypothetical protein
MPIVLELTEVAFMAWTHVKMRVCAHLVVGTIVCASVEGFLRWQFPSLSSSDKQGPRKREDLRRSAPSFKSLALPLSPHKSHCQEDERKLTQPRARGGKIYFFYLAAGKLKRLFPRL